MKKIKDFFVGCLYDFIYMPIFFKVIYFRDLKKIEKVYGKFTKLNNIFFRKNTFVYHKDSKSKKQIISIHMADVSRMIKMIKKKSIKILLDGDMKSVVPEFKKNFGFIKSYVVTVGIGKNFDYNWNFENDPPKELEGNNDLIISQAMMEHLVDPYKHLKDLVNLLRPGGNIIIHSQLPGYPYHRYPVNTVSFYPDWFEESGKRLNLKVINRSLRNFHLCYLFKKIS